MSTYYMQVVVGELMSLYLLVKCTTSRVLRAVEEYSALCTVGLVLLA